MRRRRPSPHVGVWLAVIEELVKLGRRHPVAAAFVGAAVGGAAFGAGLWWVVTRLVW